MAGSFAIGVIAIFATAIAPVIATAVVVMIVVIVVGVIAISVVGRTIARVIAWVIIWIVVAEADRHIGTAVIDRPVVDRRRIDGDAVGGHIDGDIAPGWRHGADILAGGVSITAGVGQAVLVFLHAGFKFRGILAGLGEVAVDGIELRLGIAQCGAIILGNGGLFIDGAAEVGDPGIQLFEVGGRGIHGGLLLVQLVDGCGIGGVFEKILLHCIAHLAERGLGFIDALAAIDDFWIGGQGLFFEVLDFVVGGDESIIGDGECFGVGGFVFTQLVGGGLGGSRLGYQILKFPGLRELIECRIGGYFQFLTGFVECGEGCFERVGRFKFRECRGMDGFDGGLGGFGVFLNRGQLIAQTGLVAGYFVEVGFGAIGRSIGGEAHGGEIVELFFAGGGDGIDAPASGFEVGFIAFEGILDRTDPCIGIIVGPLRAVGITGEAGDMGHRDGQDGGEQFCRT